MSSWWRKIAEARGATSGRGSWKRRVVTSLVTPAAGVTGPWPGVLIRTSPTTQKQNEGSWTRRLTLAGGPQSSSWARVLFNEGGPTS